MGRDQKKHDKKKKREQKLQKEMLHSQRIEMERRRRDQYPRIFIDPANGNPEFVQIVRECVAGMDFDDETLFQEGERTFYKLVREYGYDYARLRLQEVMQGRLDAGDEFGRVGEIHMLTGFGATMLEKIPEEVRRRYMPFNDVFVNFDRHDMQVMFSSLLTAPSSRGTVFYSDLKPTIEFNGKTWTVGFSDHAVKRICERIHPRYFRYVGSGDAHALFSNCTYFEPTLLYGNQPAFTFWDLCFEPPFTTYRAYVQGILGEENVDPLGGQCYYRVGYCPVDLEGDFAKAITFLYPGFRSTPEYGLVLKTPLKRSEKDFLLEQADKGDSTEVVLKDNSDAIKWFHEHGIPQVIQMKREVFVHYSDKRRRNSLLANSQ